MLYLLSEEGGSHCYYLINGKEYSIGRKNADIIINNDQSISRKHATFKIGVDSASVTDCRSKYGTFHNDQRINPETEIRIGDGDRIKFGVFKSIYNLKKMSIITTGSGLQMNQKIEVKRKLDLVGGVLLNNWDSTCTLLTTEEIMLTIKVLHALIDDKPLVTLQYWNKFVENVNTNQPPPNVEDFKPPLAETLVHSSDLSVNPQRKVLFKGKTFIFPTEKIKSKMEELLAKTGGTSISWDVQPLSLLEITNSKNDYVFIHSEEVKQIPQTLLDTYKHLTKLGKRTIPVQEIAMSILKCSCEKDCNPNFNRVKNVFMKPENDADSEVFPLAFETQSQELEIQPKSEIIIPGSFDSNAELFSPVKPINGPSSQSFSPRNSLSSASTSKRVREDQQENSLKKIKLDNSTLKINKTLQSSSDLKKRKAEENLGVTSKRSSLRENPFAILTKNKNITKKVDADNPFTPLRIEKETKPVDDNQFMKVLEKNHEQKIPQTVIEDSQKSSLDNESPSYCIGQNKSDSGSDTKWLSKTTCKTEPVDVINVDDEFKNIFDIFKNSLVIEVLPVVPRRNNMSDNVDENLNGTSNRKNFKKFRKVLPVKPQRSIISTSVPQIANVKTNNIVTIMSDGEEEEEEEVPSRPASKKAPARRFNF